MEKIYYSAEDIATMLDVSKAKAYNIIKSMNTNLERQGYLTIPGKVSIAYFCERWYGMANPVELANH